MRAILSSGSYTVVAYVKCVRENHTMTTAAAIRADQRADTRRRMREAMLSAAHDLAVARGWGAVRMGEVAQHVGVSRQTLYAEFGSKEALGQALVLRETDLFLLGVGEALERRRGDLPGAIRDAVGYTLEVARENPLLQTVLTGSATGDETLLPLLTSRSEPLLARSSDVLCAWIGEQYPELDVDLVDTTVDAVVRLVISHLVMPAAGGTDEVADQLARLMARGLGIPVD